MGRPAEKKDEAPFLEVDPPNWVARGLSYVIIALFLTVALLSFIVPIPETVSCPFVLVPVEGTDPIRALYDGTIVAVRATEGQPISKDYPIFTMRSDSVADRASEYQTAETRNKGARESLNDVAKKFERQTKTDQEEIAGMKKRAEYLSRMVQLKKDQLALMKEKVERYKELLNTGISSQTDYDDEQLEVKKTEVELEELERQTADIQQSIEKIRNGMNVRQVEFEESKHYWEQESERTSKRMEMLKGSFHETGKNLQIPAPCSGSLLRLKVTAPGAVVQDGDVLAEVVCSSKQLQAELNVSQSGVGRIKNGQNVKLLYESFPFQRYGVKTGTVRWIAPATGANQSGFRVLADIQENSIVVHGQKLQLLPGMVGIAEIVVGRRSIISYAFEPIQQLRENLK